MAHLELNLYWLFFVLIVGYIFLSNYWFYTGHSNDNYGSFGVCFLPLKSTEFSVSSYPKVGSSGSTQAWLFSISSCSQLGSTGPHHLTDPFELRQRFGRIHMQIGGFPFYVIPSFLEFPLHCGRLRLYPLPFQVSLSAAFWFVIYQALHSMSWINVLGEKL